MQGFTFNIAMGFAEVSLIATSNIHNSHVSITPLTVFFLHGVRLSMSFMFLIGKMASGYQI